jgi:alpha-ribazole phosphatase
MSEDKKTTRLFLVRHGEVVARGQKKFLGFTDLGLSLEGKKQMRRLAGHLKPFHLDQAVSSDLQRTLDSARILCQDRDLDPVPYAAFREMNMGAWDGKSWEEIKVKYPQAKGLYFSNLRTFRFPEGENWGQFRSRVLKGLESLLRENHGRNILLVAHAGVNRILLAQALGLRFRNMFFMEQDYACLNIIEYSSRFAVVKLMNATYY